uniref:THAP domain-containing protein 1 n=1 Tax=Cyprinus carpio TaxID=7962 RepID=A0A8C1YG49_CYPCA
MVITCIAKGCENKQRTYTNVMFHRIPSNVELRNKWLAALEICSSTPLNKIKQYRVCEEHFAPEDYFEKMEYGSRKTVLRLKDTAVPSIFKAQEEQSTRVH